MADRKIFLTGNLGYVGPTVVEALRYGNPDIQIIGFDTGFFELAGSEPFIPKVQQVDVQHYGDVRALSEDALSGVDAVVYLAAISNDPMGREFAGPTHEINNGGAVSAA